MVGAQKAGTTSLYEYLRAHPDVFFPTVKEPNYYSFADGEAQSLDKLYRPGHSRGQLDRIAGLADEHSYRNLYRAAHANQLLGDASTDYFTSPIAAARIAAEWPAAKIVVLLRDPVARAYSAYNYQASLGFEDVDSFEQAIDAERRGERDGWAFGFRYLYSSRYRLHLQRLEAHFPRERIYVMSSDRLSAAPREELDRLCAFLGLRADVKWSSLGHFNQTRLLPPGPVRMMVRAINSPTPLLRLLASPLPKGARERLREYMTGLLGSGGDAPTAMEGRLAAELAAEFAGDVAYVRDTYGVTL